MKNLTLKELGELKSISCEDFSIRPYADEQVMKVEHFLEFETGDLYVESTFSCPKGKWEMPILSETTYETSDIYLNHRKGEKRWFDMEDKEQLLAWILADIEAAGGFEELAKVEVSINLDRLAKGNCSVQVQAHDSDDEGVVAYLSVEGIDCPFMVYSHEDDARTILDDEPSEQLTLLELAYDWGGPDVSIACAYPYLGETVYHQVLTIIEKPLRQAFNQFMDGYEAGNYPHIHLIQEDGQIRWL